MTFFEDADGFDVSSSWEHIDVVEFFDRISLEEVFEIATEAGGFTRDIYNDLGI